MGIVRQETLAMFRRPLSRINKRQKLEYYITEQYWRTTKVVFISSSNMFSSFSHFLQRTIRAGELLLFIQSLKTKYRHAFLSKSCGNPILIVAWEVVRATYEGFSSDVTLPWFGRGHLCSTTATRSIVVPVTTSADL